VFVQAIRGATTVDYDKPDEVKLKTKKLLNTIIDKNDLCEEQIIYILFTVTDDIQSVYPAVGAREMGLLDTPLLCCQEMNVTDSLDRCIRILMLIQRPQKAEVFHVYQENAVILRPDIIHKQKQRRSCLNRDETY